MRYQCTVVELFFLSKATCRATCCPPDFRFCLLLFIPCAPPSSGGWSGDFGEDCLSTQCEFRSRLTCRATQGTAQQRQTGVAFFLVTFSLAKQEKVTSCRATPDGFVFDYCVHHRCASGFAATLRQADETTSHSTKLSKYDSQVAGYQGERC